MPRALSPTLIRRLSSPPVQAELLAAAWETFSALLFISAVVPGAFGNPWPALILLASIALSAALAPKLQSLKKRGHILASAIRTASWPLSVAPLLPTAGPRVLVAALTFGLMAGGMRRATYRRMLEPPDAAQGDRALHENLRVRLSEAAMLAGILGGHVMLLFSVAFLRTQSQLLSQVWFEIVPALALLGTGGFTLAIRPATRALLRAIDAGPSGEPAVLRRGLAQALALPRRLAYLNFGVWSACTAIGILTVHPAPSAWRVGDVVMELAYGSLFALGVATYQRTWQRDALAPAVLRLRRWTGTLERVEPTPLRRRMLLDFGLPLLFTGALSLLSSIGLYRALSADLSFQEDFNAISALFASFAILVIAVGVVVARAARELSVPMTELAQAADQVARGQLDAAVPRVSGPVEVVGLGESIERMRQGLARTIGELSAERAGLEANVEARTAELRRALDELRRAQAALIQGERLASIGELVAGVAHEINNPLNAIAGAAVPLEELVSGIREVLDAYRAIEPDLSPERQRALQALRERVDLAGALDDLVGISTVIKRGTERSVRIVTNLRNFSRVSGEAVPTDLHVGLEETLMLLAPRLRQANIQVVRRFGEIPPVVCRPGELNQVFINLLVNAIQALEQGAGGDEKEGREGAGVIEIETRLEKDSRPGAPIQGGRGRDGTAPPYEASEDMVAVSVTDSGPGVPSSLEQRVFDPFFTTKPRGQGTGLGLSISTEIARRHGGSLRLERPEGSGARFVCRIPVGKRPAGARPHPPEAPAQPGPRAASPPEPPEPPEEGDRGRGATPQE